MTKVLKPAAVVVPSLPAGLQHLHSAKKSKIAKKTKTAKNDDKARSYSTTGVDSLSPFHGLERWVSDYQVQRPGQKILQTQLDEYMVKYDANVKKPAEASAKQADTLPKDKHLSDFYRFQQREAGRNELLELRQKFEEDRRKIAKLKAARRFKPY
ncbi:hypothetical protein CBR_g52693 [Chara braunii]|uniref:Ribosomal RNA-processing protein 7 C-terminal domain-containing protein n=1 Tax=Chara braunii TaxID=69332 RepID=A0A388MAR0_CHABU|nr:hypothetical protein CBR_g52693 [Chara braunii]|eukprot:GBG91657.1 hypothetical protein CBR_g52693 [Chara braunii]